MANNRFVCKSYIVSSFWCRQHDGTQIMLKWFKSENGKTAGGELNIQDPNNNIDLVKRLLAAFAQAWPYDYIVIEADDDGTIVDVIGVVKPDDPNTNAPQALPKTRRFAIP